jgi:hypothetical protein
VQPTPLLFQGRHVYMSDDSSQKQQKNNIDLACINLDA